MADVTNTDFRANGVNQDTNFKKQHAFIIDCAEHAALLATGTHNIITLGKGDAVTKLRLFVLESAASGGSATVQFKLAFDNAAETINGTAVGVADLKAGDIIDMPVSKIKAFDAEKEGVLQFVVGTAALTAFKFMLIADTVPVNEFTTNG